MRNKITLGKKNPLFLQISEASLRSIQHFCATHSYCSDIDHLNRILTTIICGNYSGLTYSERTELFEHLMALEKLLPVLYELKEHLAKPELQIGDEDIYQDQVSSKDLFASFKRHPE